jgi:hypothetical protein
MCRSDSRPISLLSVVIRDISMRLFFSRSGYTQNFSRSEPQRTLPRIVLPVGIAASVLFEQQLHGSMEVPSNNSFKEKGIEKVGSFESAN